VREVVAVGEVLLCDRFPGAPSRMGAPDAADKAASAPAGAVRIGPVVREPLAVVATPSAGLGEAVLGTAGPLRLAPDDAAINKLLLCSATSRSIASSGVSPGRCPTRAGAGDGGGTFAMVAIMLYWFLMSINKMCSSTRAYG